MIVILGLIVLVAAVVVGVSGVLSNGGSAHALSHGFAVFGYHVTGSTGTLFLYGIVVGAVGLFGLSVLLAGARRTSRRGSAARRGLRQSRRETAAASQQRDDLIDQRDTARAYTASKLGNGPAPQDPQTSPGNGLLNRLRAFGRPSASRPAAAADPEPLTSQPATDVPADTTVPADDSPEVGRP
jgi:hypothetical protein